MKAGKDVVKIEKQMSGPEKLHSQAESLRARYQSQMAQIAELKAELKKPLNVPALTKAARASMHSGMMGASGGMLARSPSMYAARRC